MLIPGYRPPGLAPAVPPGPPAPGCPPAPAKNTATASPDMVAPAAVSRWKERSRPAVTSKMPSAAAVSMTVGTRRARSTAVAGGAISSPKTSRAPTAWKEEITARVIRPIITRWARRGRSPRVAAFCSLKRQHQERPVEQNHPGQGHHRRHGLDHQVPPEVPSTSPKRMATRSTANDPLREMMITPRASMPTKSRPMAVSSDRRVVRCTREMAPTITTAATAAPSTGLKPSSRATAMPGSTP